MFRSLMALLYLFFFFSSRRRHTRCLSDWSSDVCSSDLLACTTLHVGQAKAAELAAALTAEDLNPDRKSVVEGKSVDVGGRRMMKKKKKKKLVRISRVEKRDAGATESENGRRASSARRE